MQKFDQKSTSGILRLERRLNPSRFFSLFSSLPFWSGRDCNNFQKFSLNQSTCNIRNSLLIFIIILSKSLNEAQLLSIEVVSPKRERIGEGVRENSGRKMVRTWSREEGGVTFELVFLALQWYLLLLPFIHVIIGCFRKVPTVFFTLSFHEQPSSLSSGLKTITRYTVSQDIGCKWSNHSSEGSKEKSRVLLFSRQLLKLPLLPLQTHFDSRPRRRNFSSENSLSVSNFNTPSNNQACTMCKVSDNDDHSGSAFGSDRRTSFTQKMFGNIREFMHGSNGSPNTSFRSPFERSESVTSSSNDSGTSGRERSKSLGSSYMFNNHRDLIIPGPFYWARINLNELGWSECTLWTVIDPLNSFGIIMEWKLDNFIKNL